MFIVMCSRWHANGGDWRTEAHLLSGGRREPRRRVDVGYLELARMYIVQYICTILEAHTCSMRGGGLLN